MKLCLFQIFFTVIASLGLQSRNVDQVDGLSITLTMWLLFTPCLAPFLHLLSETGVDTFKGALAKTCAPLHRRLLKTTSLWSSLQPKESVASLPRLSRDEVQEKGEEVQEKPREEPPEEAGRQPSVSKPKRSPRTSFLLDAEEARRRQSIRIEGPGRLYVNRPNRHPEVEQEQEGSLHVQAAAGESWRQGDTVPTESAQPLNC